MEPLALLRKYYRGECNEQEKELVENWYLNHSETPLTFDVAELSLDLDEVEREILRHTKIHRRKMWKPYAAAAASILLFISIGVYFSSKNQDDKRAYLSIVHNDVAPGSNRAVMTLSNGKQILLTEAKKGILSLDGNQIIRKTEAGEIVYQHNTTDFQQRKASYNTITTPRGGQWTVVLPDGTKVILDAASSIKYSVAFEKERLVELSGQAYFEVVHDVARPFIIKAGNQVIEDIGTVFNVKAYPDEDEISTTLIEGAVKVSIPQSGLKYARKGQVLRRGEIAVSKNNQLSVSMGDIEAALAWKNGYFMFKDEKLTSIMQKLSRWYDIQVVFQEEVPDNTFNGEIPRNTSLVQVMKVLETAKIHFKIEGKKLTITP